MPVVVQALRACPVCEGRDAVYVHRQRFVLPEGHPLADGYDVACCQGCGFVYADVSATQADYDRFYAEESKYDDPASSTGSGESGFDRERLKETAATLAGFLPDRSARVLDIGCAGGGLLAALKELGFRDLVGVDPSAACAEMTQRRVGEAHQGWITGLPADIGTFDGVVLSHVLEHVLDVPEALAALSPLLRPDGLVYIEVPDAERYMEYVYAPFQDFNTEHVNHFSARCLDAAFRRRGFEPVGGGKRVLHASATTFTPAVYGVYRRAGPSGAGSRWSGSAPADDLNLASPPAPRSLLSVSRDTALEQAIRGYIARSGTLLARISDAIDAALAESPELIVWGAGQLTLKLLAETRLGEARIVAIVDSNPIHHGKRLAGAPIIPPAALRDHPQPILVGTLLHHQAILAQMEQLGLENRPILLPESRV